VPALLFALPCGPDEPRGNVTTARRLGRGLAARGWQCARCDVRTDPARWPSADVVVALHAQHAAPAVAAACDPRAGAPALRGRPWLVMFTGTDLLTPPGAAARAAVADAAAAVGLGAAPLEAARNLYPPPVGGLHLIRQGVDPLPEFVGWPAGVPRPEPACDLVLQPTGIRAVKDPWRGLTALAPLASRRPQLRLWIAGPRLDDTPVPALPPWARWLGSIPRAELRPLVESAQVVISTSRAEGGPPNALLEAAECGRPVLASDVAAHREFPGAPHVFGDDADFRARLAAVLDDLPGAARAGKELHARVARDFSLDAEAAAWDALLRAALAGAA
jgi:hypothetical protein